MWNRSKQIWKSGPWDGLAFGLVPDMCHNSYSLFNFTYVANENETSFSYYVIQTPYFISRTIMDFSGQFQLFSWLEKNNKWSLIWSVTNNTVKLVMFVGCMIYVINLLYLFVIVCLPSRVGFRKFKAWEIILVVVSETSSRSVVKQMHPMAKKRYLENILTLRCLIILNPYHLLGVLQAADLSA